MYLLLRSVRRVSDFPESAVSVFLRASFSEKTNGFIGGPAIQRTINAGSRIEAKKAMASGFCMEADRFTIVYDRGYGNVVSGSSYFGRILCTDDIAREIERAASIRAYRQAMYRRSRQQPDLGCFDDAPESDNEGNTTTEGATPRVARTYTLNRREVFRRAYAYATLRVSMKFLAFYSVTFPEGIADEVAVRIWNNVLTRWRQELGLRSYLWVAEKQQNGTRHYHLLTNDWMPISDTNGIVAAAIDGEVQRGNCEWGNSSLSLYNGVDVKRVSAAGGKSVGGDRSTQVKKVARYLSKYIGKGKSESRWRLWHCSRVVSALVVKAWVQDVDFEYVMEAAEQSNRSWRIYKNDWCDIVFVDTVFTEEYAYWIERVNNAIWEYAMRAGWL